MSAITREFTKEQLQEIIETDHVQCGEASALARIALASLEAEAVAWRYRHHNGLAPSNWRFVDNEGECNTAPNYQRQALYSAPPAPVSVPEAAPVAYIFKHPAGRLFWSLTDESNKGQRDVMPVYSAPVLAFVPPAIEPDYEVIKGILPTANPDEYACCIAADMWNACRAAMLQGAEPVSNRDELPDGWVACSERMPERDYVLAADFSGKQYPANLPNIQIGIYADWFDDGSPCWDDSDGNDLHLKQVTHWAQIPAAPQQEAE